MYMDIIHLYYENNLFNYQKFYQCFLDINKIQINPNSNSLTDIKSDIESRKYTSHRITGVGWDLSGWWVEVRRINSAVCRISWCVNTLDRPGQGHSLIPPGLHQELLDMCRGQGWVVGGRVVKSNFQTDDD